MVARHADRQPTSSLGGVEIASLSAEAEQVDRDRMRFTADEPAGDRHARRRLGRARPARRRLRRDARRPCRCASRAIAATLTAPATVTVQRRRDRPDAARARLRHRQPDRAGPRSPRAFDVDVAIRDDAAGARQHHPPRPRPRRHRRRHGADHRAARRAGRALRPRAPPASPRRSPAAPACRRWRCRRAAPPSNGRLNLDATVSGAGGLVGAGARRGAARAGQPRPDRRPRRLPAGAGRPGRRQPRACAAPSPGRRAITGPLADPAATLQPRRARGQRAR